jgi:protein involved in polysaccharide export with SLBB domain
MLPARLRRPQFSLKSVMLLTLGFAVGYAWNLWVWRLYPWSGTEANMLSLPRYVIEPPDILLIDVTAQSPEVQSPETKPAISGQHLVAMDGRVNLGKYGSVYVAGMTIEQTQDAIKQKLAGQIDEPRVVVDVLAYNSKVYYVIQQGLGLGDDVIRLPVTGNETVLDAIAAMPGPKITDGAELWIARPAPSGAGSEQILPIDWKAISAAADTTTNYQVFPGDRLFISRKQATPAKPRPASPAQPAAPPPTSPTELPNYFLNVKPKLERRATPAQ